MKERTRKIYIFLLILGIILSVAGILTIVLSSTVLKNWLAIGFNIRVFRRIRRIGLSLALLGTPFVASGAGMAVLQASRERRQLLKWREQREAQSQLLAKYAKKITDPNLIREVLMMIQDGLPGSKDLIERCFKQIQQMDKWQEKQQFLIQANDAYELNETVEISNDIKRRNCRAFRSIVNLCIAADSFKDLDMTKVNKRLQANDERLKCVRKLIQNSVDLINDDEAGDDTVTRRIQALNESIRERLCNENDDEEDEEEDE